VRERSLFHPTRHHAYTGVGHGKVHGRQCGDHQHHVRGLAIHLDGTLQGGTNGLALLDFNGFTNPVTLCYLTAVLSAGSHTIKPRVKAATSQTVTLDSSGDGLANYFQVVETLIAT
jgi:hypothetical protein